MATKGGVLTSHSQGHWHWGKEAENLVGYIAEIGKGVQIVLQWHIWSGSARGRWDLTANLSTQAGLNFRILRQ